jgi:hypothetical protein
LGSEPVPTVMENAKHDDLTDFPPLPIVAEALFKITEKLANELGAPTSETPHWTDFEWRIAPAVAAIQGVSSLLFAGLRWSGPERWRRFLDEQRVHVAARHEKISRLLSEIDSRARREGVTLVALKGAALHRLGVYEAGQRPMADVDLLVRDIDVDATTRLLSACEYDLTLTTWRHYLFESRQREGAKVVNLGEHVDGPIKIELHTSIRERLPVSEVDITRLVVPSAAHAGLNPYPAVASLMMHLLLHAAGNMRAHALRLIQLHDIARLAARFNVDDWEQVLDARPNGRPPWWAFAPLVLTSRYFPATVPASVIARLGAECPWWLRRRAGRYRLGDVSWTNLKIYALPGIEWARTPREAIRFISSRVWPSPETRAELKRFAEHYPHAAEIPWYGISQRSRILRWAFSKPPRVQALLPVRAAFARSRDNEDRDVEGK